MTLKFLPGKRHKILDQFHQNRLWM